ncbi:right-handed parallel beta-helix repeat-containing protein [Candidatus Methanocrinis natronophilus]|uniref:NosD domain-containing protein n=1 Tax=Candidatus Methanocrinis natronophilus TaxID=3033396 RepID=A0ABT5XB11_9EURY|nr:NosD domain-containing protein [Candidatus Methanocrinis natronophilus]MDF0591842.1 NosD domain-containing protein [Candidatus Methanocrinis natronophilus]
MSNKAIIRVIVSAVIVLALAGLSCSTTIVVAPGDRIQSAIDDAKDGDVIVVPSGLYRENLNVDKQVTLKGEDTGGGKPIINAGGDGNGISIISDAVTVQGFEVTNARIGIDIRSRSNSVIETLVGDSWTGIALVSSAGNMLKENEVRNSWRGIYLKESEDNVLYANTVRDNRWSGIVIESSDGNLIYENLIIGNYNGFELLNSNENVFKDNDMQENRFNDEPPSKGSTDHLEDIVIETSVEPVGTSGDEIVPSKPFPETVNFGTAVEIGASHPRVEDEVVEISPSRTIFELDLDLDRIDESVNEMGIIGPELDFAEEPETFSSFEVHDGGDLKVEDLVSDLDEVGYKPLEGDDTDELGAEEDISNAGSERREPADTAGIDLQYQRGTSSERQKLETVQDVTFPGWDAGSPTEYPVAEPIYNGTKGEVEEILKRESRTEDLIDESQTIERSENGNLTVCPGDQPLEEALREEILENATDGSLGFAKDDDSAPIRESSSGGWKKYEYLEALRKMILREDTVPKPEPMEMNFSEMVSIELERLDLGTISFYSPKEMTVGVSAKVDAAVVKNVQDELKVRLEALGASEAEVSKLKASMISDLRGESFRIRYLDDESLSATNKSFERWSWDVTPIKSGLYDLTLNVALVVELSDGTEIRRDYPALQRRTGVDLSFRHIVFYIIDRVIN